MDDDLNTTSARSEILSRIRALQGRTDSCRDRELANAKRYMAQHVCGPEPSLAADLVSLFVERSKSMLCTVDHVQSEAQVPAAVARFLLEHELVGPVALWPSLNHLDWSALGEVRFGKANPDDLVGVTGVAHAIAETGTLVFASQPDQPSNMHLLPETHVAIVRESQIVHTMEDVFERMRQKSEKMPRALNLVSGPSRTADIEQTLVLGAHGPYRVHVLLVEG